MKFLSGFLILFAVLCLHGKEIVAGLTEIDAARRNVEYEAASDLQKYFSRAGIRSGLLEYKIFSDNTSSGKLLSELKKFNVVILRISDETVAVLNESGKRKAAETGEALKKYVEEGGGLIVLPVGVRYQGHDDEKYWNLVLNPIGASITREGVADLTNKTGNEWKTGFFSDFFYTRNIAKHPVTENIESLWFPFYTYTSAPGTPYMNYDKSWQVVVRGEKTAGTYKKTDDNRLLVNQPGSVKSEPSIIAVRTLGKGRIVCIPVHNVHTGQNYGKPTWSHIVEDRGANGIKGGLMPLIANAVKWCAEPNRNNPAFGTYVTPVYEKVAFPESVSWDDAKFSSAKKQFRKIVVGAHSSYSDGRSTVAEYVAAAKAAGLSGIVFADPLEKLTREKFEALKKDCAAASSADFYACPGVEFTDGVGIRRFIAGEKVVWPSEKEFTKGKYTYKIWDGKRILHSGHYLMQCSFPTSAIIDYRDLEKNQVRRENLWWFWQLIPYVYENGKLVADNRKELDLAMHDIRWINLIPFTRFFSAEDTAQAANAAVLRTSSLSEIKDALAKGLHRHQWNQADVSLSLGGSGAVTIRNWEGLNSQQDPRVLKTRGTQRSRMMFDVASPNGIGEVKVIDAQTGKPFRVFQGNGEKEFSREFEMAHDRQYCVYLDVTDTKGARALSNPIYIFDYKQGLFRCGDNLNVLGPLGYWFHPDRPNKLPLVKIFRNAEKLSVMGWDRAAADCPHPTGEIRTDIYIDGKGNVSDFIADNVDYFMRMDIRLASGDLQIVDSVMDELAEKCDTAARPGPASASPPRIVARNPYITHRQRLYSPRDRMDHHIAWDHRRYLESIEEYDGSIQFFTGEITFEQDTVLAKDSFIPIELAMTQMEPSQSMPFLEKTLIAKDRQKGFIAEPFPLGKRKSLTGTLAPWSFAAALQSPVGYIALVPMSEGDWRYSFSGAGRLMFGLGTPGKLYKKGETIRYAFASLSVVDTEAKPDRVEKIISILRGNFPLTVRQGEKLPGEGILRFRAKDGSAMFSAGPAPGAGIDLPFAVSELRDNGCAAVFTTARPHFRFVPFEAGTDTVYFQEPVEKENQIWCGNVFTADNPDVLLTLVVDGQNKSAKPFMEIHNPTPKAIRTVVRAAEGTPLFSGISFTVEIPANSSVRKEFQFGEIKKASSSIKDEFIRTRSLNYLKKLAW